MTARHTVNVYLRGRLVKTISVTKTHSLHSLMTTLGVHHVKDYSCVGDQWCIALYDDYGGDFSDPKSL